METCQKPIKKNGFTLIELLIVLSIIGILVTLSFFGLQEARQSARDGRRKADLELIRSGLEIYRSDCNTYPSSLPSVGNTLRGTGSPSSCPSANIYISSIPGDPQNPSRRYYYNRTSTSSYVLCASLEQPGSGGSTSGCGSCGQACNYKVVNP